MQMIPMVDLNGQHAKIKTELDNAIQEVIETTAFIKGPQVAQFEKNLANYLQVKHAIGCANGTDALQIALMALDLPQGAEVITPDFTFVATAEVVKLLGFTPVLVDVTPDTFTLDPGKLEKAITDKTKVIVPVHLFGQCADMKSIMEIAKRHNLYVIEDNAQAIGATYTWQDGKKQSAGTMGDIGTTSFFPSKNLGCMGDGGAIFTNDDKLGKAIKMIANHGMTEQYFYGAIGVNSRLDTLQAAILDVKLARLDEYNRARQRAASMYDEQLKNNPNIEIPKRNPDSTHVFHQYTLKIKNGKREGLSKELNSKGISNKIYYPVPLHRHEPYAKGSRFDANALGNTVQLSTEVLSLPIHTELNKETVNFITKTINDFLK